MKIRLNVFQVSEGTKVLKIYLWHEFGKSQSRWNVRVQLFPTHKDVPKSWAAVRWRSVGVNF